MAGIGPRFRGVSAVLIVVLASIASGCGERGTTADADRVAPTDERPTEASARQRTPAEPADVDEIGTVSGDTLAYADVDGQLARGYLAYPDGMIEPLPAAILIHDWFGLNDEMRALADRVAGLGYIVLSIDIFNGETAAELADARKMLLNVAERPDVVRDNIRQAYKFLTKSVGAPSVAVLGWGAGGRWSLATALMYPEDISAVVIVQGQVIVDSSKLESLKMPILGIFGSADKDVPAKDVRKFADILESLGIASEVRLYPKAQRGFMLQGSRAYSAEQAASAWNQIAEFLGQNLT